MPRVVIPARDGHLNDFFDFPQELTLVFRAERDRTAIRSGTTGAADAVDISFRLVRQIEIHHQSHVLHIDPAGGDIGGDEDRCEALLEFFQRLLALRLGLVPVDGIRRKPGFAKALGQLVRAMLGAAENDGELAGTGRGLCAQQLL